MRVVISDLVVGTTCDLTGKQGAECLKVQLDDSSAEVTCVPTELIKLIRLRKKQEGNKPSEKKGGLS